MERLLWSAFITACLWSIAQSKLPESSSQEMKQTLLTSDRISILAKSEEDTMGEERPLQLSVEAPWQNDEVPSTKK